MLKVTPHLWFEDKLEEALNFYTSIFKNSKITSINRFTSEESRQDNVVSATFELEGQTFYALQAGPTFKLTEAYSMFVDCETQEEVDYLWDKLVEGGTPQQCGWLKDKYGLSWQIIPKALGELMGDKDREKAGRVIQAMFEMVKIDIAGLQRAYDGK